MTATSRPVTRAAAAALAIASAAVVAACGSGTSSGSDPGPPSDAAFAWLRPAPAPASWRASSLPGGRARLVYPRAWRAIRSDPGTVSAAMRSPSGRIRGYLNATPQQGGETLSDWSRFRPAHNRDEGDTQVTELAAGSGLRFRSGAGSCVIDGYLSSSGHRYREIACIVDGSRATTVVVGAAPPRDWQRERPLLERAISAFEN